MDGREQNPVPVRIGVGLSVLLFGVPPLLLWLATTRLLPALVERGREPLVAWFVSGALVLAPLLAAALFGAWMALPAPSIPAVLAHMRVRALSGKEWRLAGLCVLNIAGEELWWRGFIQPRQEPVFCQGTWFVQGLLHGLFHFSFGCDPRVPMCRANTTPRYRAAQTF